MSATIELDENLLQDVFLERGWTDGLPIVAPTAARVEAMLAGAEVQADELIGTLPARSRSLTAGLAAVNAVMAGCVPEYFPIVLAALGALLDPAFSANTVLSSTGGAAICTLVSGPMTAEVGMNSGHNALGHGNRANLTIGRTLRLVAMNVFDARPGSMDGSSLGHPGKIALCFAESQPPPGWPPLRVELGYEPRDTTVTLLGTEAPRQVANHLNGDPEGLLRTFAAAMRTPSTYAVGKGGQGVAVLGPEHAALLAEGGWTRAGVREFLALESRISPDELNAAGVLLELGGQHDMKPGSDGRLPTVASAEDVFLITAGGAGPGWSAWIPTWAPRMHSRASTRRVRLPGEGLPACGIDGCELPTWAPGEGGAQIASQTGAK